MGRVRRLIDSRADTIRGCCAAGRLRQEGGPAGARCISSPSPVSDVSARSRRGRHPPRFVLPVENINGPGINLERVEIYAVTVAPGAETPPNRELLTKPYLAGAG